MRSAIVWWIPQALLFAVGAWSARAYMAPGGHVNGYAVTAAGLLLAGAYTGAVMVMRDAPAHMRGVSPWARAVFRVLAFAAVGFGAFAGTTAAMNHASPLAGIAAAFVVIALFALLWAAALALWHSFTVKPGCSGPVDRGSGVLPEGASRTEPGHKPGRFLTGE
jgi:hypothetical protein